MIDVRAWGRARAVGAVHEAERLGCLVVGTEHLLIASLADPSVRWAFRTVGLDMREVQTEVIKVTEKRRPPRATGGITTDAADAIMQAGGDDEALDVDHPGAADVSRALQALAQRFLSRTKQTDARDILDGLGVIQQRARVLATIEHNARRAQPSAPGDSTAAVSSRPRQSPRLRALSRELNPDPSTPA